MGRLAVIASDTANPGLLRHLRRRGWTALQVGRAAALGVVRARHPDLLFTELGGARGEDGVATATAAQALEPHMGLVLLAKRLTAETVLRLTAVLPGVPLLRDSGSALLVDGALAAAV